MAQSADNPFGPIGDPRGQRAVGQRTGDNPFGASSPLGLLGQRSEATPQPAAAPAGEPQRALPPGASLPEPLPALPPLPISPRADDQTCKCLGETGDAAKKINEVLAAPLHSRGLEYSAVSLEQVANDVAAEYGIPIQLDVSALEDAGLGPDEPVTVNLRGISLKSALNHLLRQHNLAYIILDEVLLITTPAEAEEHLKICFYDVRDLVAGPQDVGGIDALRDVVVACVAPETWAAGGGGTGEIRPLPSGLLVVSQTQSIQEEIREMLDTIRQMSKQPPLQAAAVRPTVPRLVTRHYMLQIAAPGEPAQRLLQAQLRDLIATLVPDQSWGAQQNDGQITLLMVLPDRVVIRHNESVQRQVEAVLVDTGLTAPTQADDRAKAGPRAAGFQGGGGFGGGGGFFQSPHERD
jgi:hypothetical protein